MRAIDWTKGAPHGTYSGYQKHVRHGEKACDACREARNEQFREYRTRNTPGYDNLKRMTAARSRALWRLAAAHPDEFRTYLEDEATR